VPLNAKQHLFCLLLPVLVAVAAPAAIMLQLAMLEGRRAQLQLQHLQRSSFFYEHVCITSKKKRTCVQQKKKR
jgi:hypothetical protein